jgi:hypothetical protein
MNIQRRTAGKAEGPKPSNLHVALVADLPHIDARCAAAAGATVLTGDADGPLRAYSASDGWGRALQNLHPIQTPNPKEHLRPRPRTDEPWNLNPDQP